MHSNDSPRVSARGQLASAYMCIDVHPAAMQHWPGHGPCLLPRNMAACIPACMPACMHTAIIRIRSVLSWLTSSRRGRNRKNENWKKKINRLYIYKRQGRGRSPWTWARQMIKFRVHRAVSPAERRGYTSAKATTYTYARAPHSYYGIYVFWEYRRERPVERLFLESVKIAVWHFEIFAWASL